LVRQSRTDISLTEHNGLDVSCKYFDNTNVVLLVMPIKMKKRKIQTVKENWHFAALNCQEITTKKKQKKTQQQNVTWTQRQTWSKKMIGNGERDALPFRHSAV